MLCLLASISCHLAADAGEIVNFEREIRPILVDRCYACHGPDGDKRKADLRLDIEEEAKKFAISPGDPEDSELISRIFHDDLDERMPPAKSEKEPLTKEEAEMFRRWIEQGAPWTEHWAFEAPRPVEPPSVSDESWPQNPIDRFVMAELDRRDLAPSPRATREKLIRRASFDLTGLPPALAEIDAFVEDASADAFEKVVDRLLASAHYGERMAMDWLDGARYADSNGYQNDFGRVMWPWRDWVIDAFNTNMPYDEFAIEQIAGDLFPDATDRQRIATGFNRNNHSVTEGGSIEEEWLVENLVDRVETTSTVFLGLTMGCARCHDHKFDPITQREFYEFYAFFNSTEDKGFYEEVRGNSGPVVQLATDDDRARLREFDEEIGVAKAEKAELEAGKGKDFRGWLKDLRRGVEPGSLRVPRLEVPLARELSTAENGLGNGGRYESQGPPRWTRGLAGPALDLDAAEEAAVNLGEQFAFEHDRPFTVSLWARPGSGGTLFSKMDDHESQRGLDVFVTEDGEIRVRLTHQSPDNAIRILTDSRLESGSWSHVALAYDGSAKAEGLHVYVNGMAAEFAIRKDKLSGSTETGEALLIGAGPTGGHFDGALSDFKFFDTELTAAEIQDLTDAALAEPAGRRAFLGRKRRVLRAHYKQTWGFKVLEKGAELSRLSSQKRAYDRKIPSVMVMKERDEPRPTYRLKRGEYDKPDTSEQLYPGVPALLPPLRDDAPRNRLGLAQWIVDPENPLTARVTVNRLWQKFFGQGLVRNSENFGIQTDPPSHPMLLDWLALRFMASDWDLKAIQKEIVMSAAYQQDSAATADLLELDPENRLLARGPRYRLPAELIRDNALSVSGLLVSKIGGPPVKPYQPEGMWQELAGGASQGPYVQGTGDDLYRRSLYTYRKRTVPHTTLSTFDAPSFEFCQVRRARTNTPLQSLALLNDTTYVEAARKLAERMLVEAEPDSRVAYGFRLATGRMPSDREAAILRAGLEGYEQMYRSNEAAAEAMATQGEYPVDDSIDRATLAAYTAVAGVILNLDESITKD